MKKEPIFYLNGKQIRSLHTLGKVLRNTFYFDERLNLKNLNVINDVMRGGFGILNQNEPITLIWQNHKSSERNLDADLYAFLLKIFEENPNINLVLD
jgi:hypothetical protein